MGNALNFSDIKQKATRIILKSTVGVRYGLNGITYKRSNEHAKIEELRGQWAGRPAVIVANGPSLNQTPLDDFIGTPSIGMNKIDDRIHQYLLLCVPKNVLKGRIDAKKVAI